MPVKTYFNCDVVESTDGIVLNVRSRVNPTQKDFNELVSKIRERFKKEGVDV